MTQKTIKEKFCETFNISKTRLNFKCDICQKECPMFKLRGRFACIDCDNPNKEEINEYPTFPPKILMELEELINKKGIKIIKYYESGLFYCTTFSERFLGAYLRRQGRKTYENAILSLCLDLRDYLPTKDVKYLLNNKH